MSEPVALLAMGFGVGFLVGLTSVGGAALLTPFLILILGVRPRFAIGIDLIYAFATKIVGGVIHWRQGQVDFGIVRALAIGSIPGGIVGSLAVHAINRKFPASDQMLRNGIGATLLLVALGLALRGNWSRKQVARRRCDPHRDWAAAAWGVLVGVMVGLTSIGSGTLVLPFLVWAYDAPAARLVGTNIFHAAILLGVTGCLFAGLGSVQWDLTAWLLGGSLPGVALGSRLAPRLPEKALRFVLMLILLVSAWRLIG